MEDKFKRFGDACRKLKSCIKLSPYSQLETPSSALKGEESGNDSGHCSPEPEFMKVRAQVKSKSGSGNR